MTKKMLISLLAALALTLGLAACEEEAAEETEETTEDEPDNTPVEDEADDEAPAEEEAAADEGGGGDVCEQARACCTAYVEAAGANNPALSADTACAGIANAQGPAAAPACQAALQGYRTSINALPNVEMPDACAE